MILQYALETCLFRGLLLFLAKYGPFVANRISQLGLTPTCIGQLGTEAGRNTACIHKNGALFITFNVGGDPRKALGFYRGVDGTILDSFTLISQVRQ